MTNIHLSGATSGRLPLNECLSENKLIFTGIQKYPSHRGTRLIKPYSTSPVKSIHHTRIVSAAARPKRQLFHRVYPTCVSGCHDLHMHETASLIDDHFGLFIDFDGIVPVWRFEICLTELHEWMHIVWTMVSSDPLIIPLQSIAVSAIISANSYPWCHSLFTTGSHVFFVLGKRGKSVEVRERP